MKKLVSLDATIELLKTIAEENRLRILALLCREDLRISDFTFILGQSQSCVSRHLRLLYEAWLITCYQKGGETYFKFCHSCCCKDIIIAVVSALPKHDVILAYDLACLMDVKKQHQKMRRESFLQNTAQWDALRLSYIADHVVENALLEIIGDKPFETMLSVSIDKSSILKLFSDFYRYAVEVILDSNILHLSVGDTTFDLILFHWALHFLEDPEMALYEVARILRPHGCLLIVDFVAHEVDSLHSNHTHMHLGFSDSQIEQWVKNAGLVLEQTICLAPMQKKNNEDLVVTIWFARDPRLLIDDIKDKKVDFA
ncbi:ArsR/SmtB family transcription factor [Bartonella phoceensis]|uniref:ArsR/SmtB family transcription factor n=1 Tax=Bartonella phoceensis TaxID=270249 RepID=UPI001ABB9572|nr:ArsR family transcriptional regulator [Bartonella phoceensis]